jgi:hypothetical protein
LQSAYRGNLFHRIDDLRITPTIEISRRVKFRSEVGHMERRLAWSRLGGGSELFEVESVWRLLGRMLRSLWTVRQLKFPKRVELSLWAICCFTVAFTHGSARHLHGAVSIDKASLLSLVSWRIVAAGHWRVAVPFTPAAPRSTRAGGPCSKCAT